MYISKRSGMDHTVLPSNTPCLPFLRMRSPDGSTPNWGKRHPIAAYCSSIDPEGMKGWVGQVGWPIADGLPTYVVTRQLQVERRSDRTGKVRRPKREDRRSTTVPRNQPKEQRKCLAKNVPRLDWTDVVPGRNSTRNGSGTISSCMATHYRRFSLANKPFPIAKAISLPQSSCREKQYHQLLNDPHNP